MQVSCAELDERDRETTDGFLFMEDIGIVAYPCRGIPPKRSPLRTT